MFDNIGSKIKLLAEAITAIGVVASIISGIAFMNSGSTFVFGLIVAVLGSVLSWICSFIIYGFGQLIENTDQIICLMKKEEINNFNDTSTDEQGAIICPHCERKVDIPDKTKDAFCPWCKKRLF